jgi:TRAP-type C4-dicarboxylate transport system permease large subunit
VVLNVVSGVARVPFGQVVVGVTPFLLGQIALLFLLTLVPQLVTVPLDWLR